MVISCKKISINRKLQKWSVMNDNAFRTTLTSRGQPCPTVNLPAFSKLSNNKYLPFSVKIFFILATDLYSVCLNHIKGDKKSDLP